MWVLLSWTQKYFFCISRTLQLIIYFYFFAKKILLILFTQYYLLLKYIFFYLFWKSKVIWKGERLAFQTVYIIIWVYALNLHVKFWWDRLGKKYFVLIFASLAILNCTFSCEEIENKNNYFEIFTCARHALNRYSDH